MSTQYGFKDIYKNARDLMIEFGPGEIIDTVFARPAAMVLFPLLIPNYAFAILIASIVADLAFYTPTILAYELKKKYLKD